MTYLSIALLGPPQILLDGRPVTAFKTQKVQALLAFLAVEAARPHRRDELTGLLWPEQPEAAARDNLRVSLYRLRQALDDRAHAFLAIRRDAIQFNARSDHWLDVAAFDALLAACRAHNHAEKETCAECAARLARAAELHRGEFLAGLSLADSAGFAEWLLVQREALHLQVLDALTTLSAYHERRGDYDALCRAARQQLSLEPWREPAHRQLMRGLALSGDRAAALAQYEKCRNLLATELGVEPDIGTRGLAERIQAGRHSPLTLSAPALAHSLPAQFTPFVGRESELAAVTARLYHPDVRLLTLAGAGGMGKTRLALRVARAQLNLPVAGHAATGGEPAGPAFRDGIFFVSLAPLTAAEMVPAIAAAIGLTMHGGDPRQTLLRALRHRSLLLILDNFEHLLGDPSSSPAGPATGAGDAVDLVVDILRTAPLVRLIVTSRERLSLRGEHVHVLEGMDYTVEHAASSSAVRLFIQSVRRVQPGFTFSDAAVSHVRRICELVQGMPLAIELAAAWAEMLPLEMIAAEIEQSIDFLSFDWRDVPARQRSVRAVFDWSWRLLNDTERQAFRRLSVFRGGCTREAAQAVAGASLPVLTRLAHKSLLRWAQGQGEVGRYEVHELLRQFAAEQLEGAGEERETVHARHSSFYLAFVAARGQRLMYDDPHTAAAEIRAELDNVRQAWAWAAAHSRVADLERSANPLFYFYR